MVCLEEDSAGKKGDKVLCIKGQEKVRKGRRSRRGEKRHSTEMGRNTSSETETLDEMGQNTKASMAGNSILGLIQA